MTGFKSKRQAALDEEGMYLVHHTEPAQESTLQEKDRKRGSIALARSLCYQIAGAASEDDDISGSDYGSVDVAEILSAEVVRLQAALAQPAQEPVEDVMLYHDDGTRIVRIAAQRPWVDLTDEEIDKWTPEIHGVIREVIAQFKEKNNG